VGSWKRGGPGSCAGRAGQRRWAVELAAVGRQGSALGNLGAGLLKHPPHAPAACLPGSSVA